MLALACFWYVTESTPLTRQQKYRNNGAAAAQQGFQAYRLGGGEDDALNGDAQRQHERIDFDGVNEEQARWSRRGQRGKAPHLRLRD